MRKAYPRNILATLIANWQLVFLFVLSSLVLLVGLGTAALYSWDEAIYAQVSKEMIQTGDWVTMHWAGEVWFHKPPLYFWLTSVLYQIFEVNEFWSRAVSAFAGIGVVVTTFLIGSKLLGRNFGLLAGLILLTGQHFLFGSRFGTTDILLTLCIYVAIFAYLLERHNPKWWYLIGLACGLAIMTKGVAGLAAPMIILAAVIVEGRILKVARLKQFWMAIVTGLAVVIPWHVAVYLLNGQKFIDDYFLYHVVKRATEPIEDHVGGKLFYLEIIGRGFYPWYYLAPFALIVGAWKYLKHRNHIGILVGTALLILGLYTLTKTKLDWYIMPIYPALALLVAALIKAVYDAKLPLYRLVNQKIIIPAGVLGLLIVALLHPNAYPVPSVKSELQEVAMAMDEGALHERVGVVGANPSAPATIYYLNGVARRFGSAELLLRAFNAGDVDVAVLPKTEFNSTSLTMPADVQSMERMVVLRKIN